MGKVLLLVSIFVVGIACKSTPVPQNLKAESNITLQPSPERKTQTVPVIDDLQNDKGTPPNFQGIDFRNFSYRTSLRGYHHRTI